ncbi:MAG: DUF4174 domain-containing protein [Adhaeribacter sp.]
MKKLGLIVGAVLIFFLGLPTAQVQAQTNPLMQSFAAPVKAQKRIVLVFAATAADARWQRQQVLLQQAHQELQDRDLVVVGVLGNQVNAGPAKMGKLPPPETLREQYKIKPDEFTVVLVGKDGTEKYRAPEVIKPGTIFHIIDAMPMRQQEMRRQEP